MNSSKRNPFKGYQTEKQSCREQLIRDYLAYLAESKVSFENVTGLAMMVAKHLSELQDKACDKSTLLRNQRYKSLLLTHMATRRTKGAKSVAIRAVNDGVARAAIAAAELRAANLQRDVERLKAYSDSLEKGSKATPLPKDESGREVERLKVEIHDEAIKFSRTCQTLFKVLQQMDRVLSIDPEQRRILDLSKSRNNVVVDETLAGPFFVWLASTRELGTKAT